MRGRVLWTAEDDALIREHYTTMPPVFLANRLKRTPAAVRTRARKLGVQRAPDC